MSRLCVTITERRDDQLQAAADADLVELRLDHLGVDNWQRLAQQLGKPAIITYRRHDQGGAPAMAEVDEEARLRVLADAARDPHAAYVDIEHGCQQAMPSDRRAQLVVSHHDFAGMPEDLTALCRRIAADGADVVKVAVTPRDAHDQAPVYAALREMRRANQPAIVLAMGEHGQATRVLGLREGALWTYAAPHGGAEAAPGQYTLRELRRLYRAGRLSPETRVYGVIGEPIGHSLSPLLHNTAFEATQTDAVYVAFRVSGDPAAFVRAMQELPVLGFSVTIPHKTDVMAAMDEIDAHAGRIGAVNTVTAEGGRLLGSNTDEQGALTPLQRALDERGETLEGRRVCVVGAGGAARAIVCGLAAAGADVTIANRTPDRAEALAGEFGVRGTGLGVVTAETFDVLINVTPVGMHPKVGVMPVPEEALREGMIVFDTVYNPLETELLRRARACGCRTIDGLEMFVGQGVAQFERWTGLRAPRERMREACLKALALRQ